MLSKPVILPDLLDIYFRGLGEVSEQREITGNRTWRASLLGSCLRRQYLELKDHAPFPAQADARTQRIFAVGHLTGDLIRDAFDRLGILREEELPLDDEEWDVGAHVDFIVGGKLQPNPIADPLIDHVRGVMFDTYGPELPIIGVELKSKHAKSFWWAKKQHKPVAGENQLIQTGTYDLLARKHGYHVDQWYVLSVAKDDLSMAADPVTALHRQLAKERLETLNRATSALDVPCTCLEDFGGKGWKYCPYGVDEWTCCEPEGLLGTTQNSFDAQLAKRLLKGVKKP